MPEGVYSYGGDMKKIEGGLIADVTNFLKTISDIAFKAFDKLYDLGIITSDMQQTDGGGFKWEMSTKDKSHKVSCEATPVSGKDNTYNIKFKSDTGKTYNINDVSDKEFYDAFDEAIETLFGMAVEELVSATSKLEVALKRIVGKDESSIELCGINTTLPIKSTVDILNNLMVDEFIETIPETETWYSVTDVGEDYDVNECEACECDISDSLIHCLTQAFQCLSSFQAVHWNAVGKDFFTLHEKLDEYIEQIQSNIDELAEMYKQTHNIIPSPAVFYQSVTPINVDGGFDIEYGFNAVKAVLDVYTMTLSCYYCNLPSDMQSKFDEYLAYWNKEVQYKLDSLLGYGN